MRNVRLFLLATLSFTILTNSALAQGKIVEGAAKVLKQTTSVVKIIPKSSALRYPLQDLKALTLSPNASLKVNTSSQLRVMPEAQLKLCKTPSQTLNIKSPVVPVVPTELKMGFVWIKATENPAISEALRGKDTILVIDWSKLKVILADYNLVSEINRMVTAEGRVCINGIGIINCNEKQANDLISLINSYTGSGEEVIRVGVEPAKSITEGTYYLDIQKEINLDELDMFEYNFNTEDVEETKKNTFTRIFNIEKLIEFYDDNKENIISDFAA